uniref:Endonuclease/exonuclease/phosphatase domain-containing protein n=1 Tax=Plectus sambesii TaxID=2011161 RepID=A0A914VPA2_9BILA
MNLPRPRPPPTRRVDLRLCTFNARLLCANSQLSLLMDECQRVKFDVIGLSETKRKEPLTATWRDGSGVFLGARKEDSISGGVSFIVAPHFLHRVRDARIVSHRLAVLEFEVSPQLTGSLIQAYAPVLDADEQEHADFYDNLSNTVRECRSHYKFISGDFNARVGPR